MVFFKNAIRKWVFETCGVRALVRTAREGRELSVISVELPDDAIEKCSTRAPPDFVTKLSVDSESKTAKYSPNAKLLQLDIDQNFFTSNVLGTFKTNLDSFGKLASSAHGAQPLPKNVVIEYSSPNIAKPFHYGHLRSTIIGNFVSNLEQFLGSNVTRINYLGDWGTQFGLLSIGYDLYGDNDELSKNACQHLLDVYIKANVKCDKDSTGKLREKAKQRFAVLEQKADVRVLEQWTRFREYSVENFKRTYSRIGIKFDEIHGESMYSKAGFEVVEKLEQLGILRNLEDGARIAQLSHGVRTQVPIIKADGSTLYLTRDIAAAMHRMDRYNFDEMIYVVDIAQKDHFKALKDILRQMGLDWESRVSHLDFGRVTGMSTRKGTSVLLEDILDEAKERATQNMKIRETTKSSPESFDTIADVLGITAIVVDTLKIPRTMNYAFNWDQVLKQDEGVSFQYAHARLCNLELYCGFDNEIIESIVDDNFTIDNQAIDCRQARELIVVLSQFDDALIDANLNRDSQVLVKYLFRLSHAIARAYNVMQIKNSSLDTAKSRLLLFRSARNVLAKGMQIIGLEKQLTEI